MYRSLHQFGSRIARCSSPRSRRSQATCQSGRRSPAVLPGTQPASSCDAASPLAAGAACIYHGVPVALRPAVAAANGGASPRCPSLKRARDIAGRGRGAAQARGGVRGLRARRVSRTTRPPFGIDRGHGRRARRSRSSRKCRCTTPFATLLHFRKDDGRSRTARADRRADVRALRHAAARHRAHDARRPRRLHHRLAQRARRAARRRAASASTNTSST